MATARFAMSRTMRTRAIFNMMNALIERHREAIAAVAASRHVRQLAIFGSAAAGPFDPARSDIDVLVEFEQLAPVDRADAYFGLLEDLERLFERPVDLVEDVAIRNPYLRRSVEASRVVVYEAA
jgi:hypothetical protein